MEPAVKQTDVLGDVVKELPPVAVDEGTVTVTMSVTYARKLGKSVSKTRCESIADAVKNKESLAFLKSLNNGGIPWEELDVNADVKNFIAAYL